MRRRLYCVPLLAALTGLACTANAAGEGTSADPALVTFGPLARINEGDHDFRQLIRISLPASAGVVKVRVFDPDAGGEFDEANGGFDTTTKFSLYGAGASPKLWRDAAGVVQESVDGAALAASSFATDAKTDGQWVTLFSTAAGKGAEAADGKRSFVLLVEGVSGNDGNVFDVAVSQSDDANKAPAGTKLYSYMPTFQVPRGNKLAELGLDVPAGAKELVVENFDAAGGAITFAGRFRSTSLSASGKSEWRRDNVTLANDEPSQIASVTAADGGETPNDMTVFVGEKAAGSDPADKPVAIDLPVHAFAPNKRPQVALKVTPQACGAMSFDASGSRDPEGSTLSYRWMLGADSAEGATVEKKFAAPGVYQGRLEAFDASGLIGNGSAHDFSFFVKPPPVASFEAPALVAEGASFMLDGTASTSPSLPDGVNKLARYQWAMGDGTVIEQKAGDAGFGKLDYRYASHGVYAVTLTVTDSADNPCNTATTTRSITVNAPPVANAGGNRTLIAGTVNSFDAGLSHDPDGTIVSYLWDFGDGGRAAGPAIPHTFHHPGEYKVSLTVIDDSPFENGKGIDTITVTVREADNQRPVAQAGDDRTVEVGQPVRFDGRASRDPDGEILNYGWDFGDGAGSDLPVVEHSYWQPGTYAVALTVADNGAGVNGSSVDQATITVTPAANRAPVAAFPSEFSTTTFRPLKLDASKANDRDGSIIAYDWDFGDGEHGLGPVLEHLYAKPGVYDGRLVLTDNGLPQPASVAFDFKVRVANRPNLAPVASAGKDVTAAVGAEVVLDASASTDADGAILSYLWDFGDGNHASGIRTHHVYQFPASYKVTLTVEDDGPADKLRASDDLVVTINAVPNTAPVASVAGPTAVKKGEIVRFDASASGDADGNILRYRWDFGDGGTSQDARPLHAFHDAGSYRVRLTVTDDGTVPASASAEIETTVTDAVADGGVQ